MISRNAPQHKQLRAFRQVWNETECVSPREERKACDANVPVCPILHARAWLTMPFRSQAPISKLCHVGVLFGEFTEAEHYQLTLVFFLKIVNKLKLILGFVTNIVDKVKLMLGFVPNITDKLQLTFVIVPNSVNKLQLTFVIFPNIVNKLQLTFAVVVIVIFTWFVLLVRTKFCPRLWVKLYFYFLCFMRVSTGLTRS